MGFIEHGEGNAEAGIGGFGAGDGLKYEIDRRAAAQRFHLGGDVRQDAGLGRDLIVRADAVQHVEEGFHGSDVVAGGIDADHGIAATEAEAVENAGGDALQIVGGMIWLEAGGHAAGQSDGGAEAGHDAALCGDGDEVLQAHQLTDGGGNFGSDAGG